MVQEKPEVAGAESGGPRGRERVEAPGGMGTPEGPPRFECPPDFCASRFAPGPPFSLETLQDPSKELLLIQAPANFSPESLNGHVLPFLGSQTLKVPQSNGTQKLYSIHVTPGTSGSCAHLLVPSGHQDHLTCAPPFSGSLNIWERCGDPGANPALFPVADRPVPQIPEGLKHRFVPFGGQLKRPAPKEAAEKSPQKKKRKKKRQLHMVGYMGDPEEEVAVADKGPETPLEESVGPAEGPQEGRKNHHQLRKGAEEEEKEEEGGSWHEQDSPPLFSSQEGLFSAEVPSHKRKKKKKKLREEVVESKELLVAEPGTLTQPSESEPGLQLEFATPAGETSTTGVEEPVRHKQKKKKKKKHEGEATTLMDLVALKEEPMTEPWEVSGLGSPTEGSLGLAEEKKEVGFLSHKSKKKKKKKEKMEEQEGQEWTLLEQAGVTIKEEGKDWDEPAAFSGEGVVQGESVELSVEVPGHKHKKKKKKEHKREVD